MQHYTMNIVEIEMNELFTMAKSSNENAGEVGSHDKGDSTH